MTSKKASTSHKSSSSCLSMMQSLLREGIKQSPLDVKPREQEQWGSLLTNKYKLQLYKQQLKVDIQENSKAASHLRFLLFILEQLQNSALTVYYQEQDLRLDFTSAVIEEQQRTIQQLQAQNEQKDKELLEVGQEYEKILVNFNGVIQHLVQKQKPTHDHL